MRSLCLLLVPPLFMACYSPGDDPRPQPTPPAPPEPTTIDELSPTAGPFGTAVSITGENLRASHALLLGADQVVMTPRDRAVLAYDDALIEFRFPFPYEGTVALELDGEVLVAGEFTPSFVAGPPAALAEPELLHSMSPGAGKIAAAFAGEPALVLVSDGKSWSRRELDLQDLDPASVRLFLNDVQELEALAVSADGERGLVHFVSDGDSFERLETGFSLAAEHALAGGTEGATAWSHEDHGWYRFKSGADGFTRDRGPVPEPASLEGVEVRAAGATSAGALHVVFALNSRGTIDDLGYPNMVVVPADGESFGERLDAGEAIDDSITELYVESRGDGLLVHYKGVDVDAFGNSDDETVYRSAAILLDGTVVTGPAETEHARLAVGRDRAALGYCTANPNHGSTRLIDDLVDRTTSQLDLEALPGDEAAWPCKPLLAAEIDASGELLVLLAHDSQIYAPRARR